jgi:hypothetical protein
MDVFMGAALPQKTSLRFIFNLVHWSDFQILQQYYAVVFSMDLKRF